MEQYLLLAAGVLGIPLVYAGAMAWYSPAFEKEENRNRKRFRSPEEILIFLSAEAALVCVWRREAAQGEPVLLYLLLLVMLAAMTFFCAADLWEHVVPNPMLLLLVLVFVLLAGMTAVRDMEAFLRLLPSIFFGEIFCVVSFGLAYLLSRGSMGAGDVKLALVMGLYLTGEYVSGAVLYGCLAAALFSLVQLARKKLGRRDKIPFVPFLYIGLIIRYIAG